VVAVCVAEESPPRGWATGWTCARLDPGGVFDRAFTKRVGLSSDRFAA